MSMTLTGTEKQIAWAEQILAGAHAALPYYRAAAEQILATYGDTPALREMLGKVLARIEGETDSRWWIDHRNSLSTVWGDRPDTEPVRMDEGNLARAASVLRELTTEAVNDER